MHRAPLLTLICRYCVLEKPIEEFRVIGKSENRRRDHRCRECMEAIPLRAIYERDKKTCGICHKHVPFKHASIDHIIPICQGGKHALNNVQLAHRRCNHLKGPLAPWEMTHFGS